MRVWLSALLLWLASLPATALIKEEVISALSQNRIAITANFDGSEIFVYGAIKREAPVANGKLGVIVTVAGPSVPTLVRRKSRIFGIWINSDSLKIDAAPTFYAVASSAPLASILHADESLQHKIRIAEMIKSIGPHVETADAQAFPEALMRIREKQGLYAEFSDIVELRSDTLFGTHIPLPANLVEGEYTATVYVTRDGVIVDKQERKTNVQKVGLGRWIYALAHEQPLIYGILAVLLATFTGWIAAVAFRRI